MGPEHLNSENCDPTVLLEAAIKANLILALSEGCRMCRAARTAATNLARTTVEKGQSPASVHADFKAAVQPELCQGKVTNDNKQFCHEPDEICGSPLGEETLEHLWEK